MLLFLLLGLTVSSSSAKINCQREDIKYEKVIGLRPGNFHPLLLHQSDNRKPATVECLKKCSENEECLSFVLYYKNNSCFWFKNEANRVQDENSVLDSGVAWFKKTCYKANCNLLWIFERIPGATLVGNNTKILPEIVTRTHCQQYCLNETTFQCRSAKFIAQTSYHYQKSENYENLGKCILSDSDRHISPNSFRASSYDDEYFENQCSPRVVNEFCAFEEYENVALFHVDIAYENMTKIDCQNVCENNEDFRCRGFSLLPPARASTNILTQAYICLIHSENSKVHGPKSLKEHPGAKYYERAPCLNITVSCTHNDMIIHFQPDVSFNGRLYMKGYSENPECFALGHRRDAVVLKIPLIVQRCGIVEIKSALNRTLMSSTMILQYNSLVQTQADRIIKVGCVFNNSTNVVVGAGFNFTEDHSSSGSNLINTTTVLPTVEMRIVDLTSRDEVSDTQIGDELQLLIEMKPADAGIDVWAGHLVAMTESGQDSILLLDDRGCPTNLDVFPGLTKTVTDNNTVLLSSTFQAFKFSTSSIIRFSVMVQFCANKCPPVNCGGITYNKQKRDIETSDGNTIRLLNRSEFQQEGTRIVQHMPLELVLVVRNANIKPDRLVYGENNKILVAGFDYATNEVCIDFSLLIGLIVTWILIQITLVVSCIILIRKYKKYYEEQYLTESYEELHKNFGLGFSNLDTTKRVHFADNGHLT